MVRSFLQGCAYEVILGDSGKSALETFRIYLPPISAVVTDIMMDGMNGSSLRSAFTNSHRPCRSRLCPTIFKAANLATAPYCASRFGSMS